MHELDVYFEAMSVFWALVPAYFVVAFLVDERAPRLRPQQPGNDAPVVDLRRHDVDDKFQSATEPLGAPSA